jgi:hypothetical protein
MLGKFVIKALLNSLVVVPLLLWFTEASFAAAVVTSLLLSIVAYFIGDQMILRFTSNAIATLADAVLAFAFLWMAADMQGWSLSMSELISIVILLGFVEYLLHSWLIRDDNKRTA